MSNLHDENEPVDANGRAEPYQFGEYTLDPIQRVLLRFGKEIHLKPKTFEVLEHLLERADRVVLKNEILEAVWNDAFVEESNLTVQVSVLRKIFGSNGKSVVSIETIPKVGYRLNVSNGDSRAAGAALLNGDVISPQSTQLDQTESAKHVRGMPADRRVAPFFGGIVIGILAIGSVFYFLDDRLFGSTQNEKVDRARPFKHHSFKTLQCPREVPASVLVPGGCEEAVASFAVTSNPNGNWSYGYTQKDDRSNFVLFSEPVSNNHYASPEVPTDIWRRPGEWHPSILHNTSALTIVIQEGVVVPPHMFEMHPGPNGERSVLRWTAPVDGHFRVQGQFRGLNTNGDTTTDVLVVFNGKEIVFSDNVIEYNLERPFEVTFKAIAGDTVDLSVGYGSNEAYECDSTGVSVMVTTISLANSQG